MRLYADFLGGPRAVALLFLRLVAGSAMMLHGWPKIQHPTSWMPPEAPIPGWLQFLAALSEFGGGLSWVLGALTPLFSLGIFCTMAFATFAVHIRTGDPFVADPATHGPSYEPALGYMAISVLLLIVGPGRISVDALLFGRSPKARTVPADDLPS